MCPHIELFALRQPVAKLECSRQLPTNAASYILRFVSFQLAQEDTDAAGGRASGAFPILEAAVPYIVVLPISRSVLDE